MGDTYHFNVRDMSLSAHILLKGLGFSEETIQRGEVDISTLPDSTRPMAEELLGLLKGRNYTFNKCSAFNNIARFLTGIDGNLLDLSATDIEYYLKLKDNGFIFADTCLIGAKKALCGDRPYWNCEIPSEDVLGSCLYRSQTENLSAEMLKKVGIDIMALPNGENVYYVGDKGLYEEFKQFIGENKCSNDDKEMWGIDIAEINAILSSDLIKEVVDRFVAHQEENLRKQEEARFLELERQKTATGLMSVPTRPAAANLQARCKGVERALISRIIIESNPPSEHINELLGYYEEGRVDLRVFSDAGLKGLAMLLRFSKKEKMSLDELANIAKSSNYDEQKIRAVIAEMRKELAAEKRIKAFFSKQAADGYISLIPAMGHRNVELALKRFVSPDYPAPADHTAFDTTSIDDITWMKIAKTFRPGTDIPDGVRAARESVSMLNTSLSAEGFYIGERHGTKVCIAVSNGYAVYLTAAHVINRKHHPFKYSAVIPNSDVALVAVPLSELGFTPKPLRLGERLKPKEIFYSIGFGGDGDHPLNLGSGAYYDKDRLSYTSASCPGDSGGAVLNSCGELVGIMHSVGAESVDRPNMYTLRSRFATHAFGDMEEVGAMMDSFIETLPEL